MSDHIDPFDDFNSVLLAICDEERREATLHENDPWFPPIPLMRSLRRKERRGRFVRVATKVYHAMIERRLSRDESAAKVRIVATALKILMAEPWWQRVNTGEDAKKKAAVIELNERLQQVHEAGQAVLHMGHPVA